MKQKRMLLSFAHPDDETFGMGATIARYARQGVQVELICATNGEAGVMSEECLDGYETIEARRIAELNCAAEILGLQKIHRFNYRDSGMTGAPDNEHPNALCRADRDEVTRRVVEVIRAFRPQVIVTFDPYGGYGHPDHIMMHEVTVAAFHAAPDPAAYPDQLAAGLEPYRPQRLYHMNFSRFTKLILYAGVAFARLRGQDPTRMGENEDINLVEAAQHHNNPVHAMVNIAAYNRIGDHATLCHASQLGGLQSALPQWMRTMLFGAQAFTQIAPPRERGAISHDLFDGVVVGHLA